MPPLAAYSWGSGALAAATSPGIPAARHAARRQQYAASPSASVVQKGNWGPGASA